MAREAFKVSIADRNKIQVIETDDLPERVSIDLDDKDPNNIQVIEVDDRPEGERGSTRDPAQWESKNSTDPKGVTPRVQKRFDRLKAETETERRIRLEAERQRDEAVNAAQRQQAEINDLRRRLDGSNISLATSMTDERKVRMADATRRLEQAHAEGNSAEIAKATADISTAAAELTAIAANTPRPKADGEQQQQQRQQEQPPQRQQTQAPQLASNVVGWIAANPWFNKDVAKTRVAVSIHNALEARGIAPESDAYTRELDKGMKAMYPEHQPYSGSQPEDGDDEGQATAPRRTNAVAPGSRETGHGHELNPRTVELTASQLAIAKRLGVTPQAYAIEMIKYDSSRKGA